MRGRRAKKGLPGRGGSSRPLGESLPGSAAETAARHRGRLETAGKEGGIWVSGGKLRTNSKLSCLNTWADEGANKKATCICTQTRIRRSKEK